MTFNSWEFLLFYPIVTLLCFLLPKKLKAPMLLIASYYFYMCYQTELVVLIFGTTLVSYLASNLIERTERRALKRLALAVTLIACFGVLLFYKYFNFLSGSVSGLIELFGGTPSYIELNLMLPVGVSFYTFQTLSYVIDVYRGSIKTERSFMYFALFVSYFPQLVAGPIERPANLLPQLKEPKKFSRDDAIKGAKHMIVGFFKKICVADLISVYVNSVYNAPESASSLSVIIATCLFAVQIYCDFSGYTDIAIGCSRIMGIRLMQNFDHPYSATTVKEFWSRWHISLSSWFKDYLYIPLGGNRCARWRHLLNIMIVFLVSGLWHGASWTFVIWGGLHGIYQVIGSLTIKPRNALLSRIGLSERSRGVIWLRRIITFILVGFAWIFFRANSLSDAWLLISRLFGSHVPVAESLSAMGMGLVPILMCLFSIAVLIMIDRMLTYDDSPDASGALVKGGSFVYFVWIVFFAWALLLSKDMMSTFIYFQF
ncbi:MAG: MBOAT family protein [Clostridia bacterium]|nr:MBOAT family protein [Clostridia bacterium]